MLYKVFSADVRASQHSVIFYLGSASVPLSPKYSILTSLSSVECALVSVAASAPLIRPLFVRIREPSGDTSNAKSYEMRQYGQSKGERKSTRLPSFDEEPGVDNSSQRNVLAVESERIPRMSSDIVMERSFVVSYEKGGKDETGF